MNPSRIFRCLGGLKPQSISAPRTETLAPCSHHTQIVCGISMHSNAPERVSPRLTHSSLDRTHSWTGTLYVLILLSIWTRLFYSGSSNIYASRSGSEFLARSRIVGRPDSLPYSFLAANWLEPSSLRCAGFRKSNASPTIRGRNSQSEFLRP
jgi:hypothetical protein